MSIGIASFKQRHERIGQVGMSVSLMIDIGCGYPYRYMRPVLQHHACFTVDRRTDRGSRRKQIGSHGYSSYRAGSAHGETQYIDPVRVDITFTDHLSDHGEYSAEIIPVPSAVVSAGLRPGTDTCIEARELQTSAVVGSLRSHDVHIRPSLGKGYGTEGTGQLFQVIRTAFTAAVQEEHQRMRTGKRRRIQSVDSTVLLTGLKAVFSAYGDFAALQSADQDLLSLTQLKFFGNREWQTADGCTSVLDNDLQIFFRRGILTVLQLIKNGILDFLIQQEPGYVLTEVEYFSCNDLFHDICTSYLILEQIRSGCIMITKERGNTVKRPITTVLGLSVLLVAGCAGGQKPAETKEPTPAPTPTEEAVQTAERIDNIYIFYTSDVHCGVDENLGFAKLKALVDDTRAESENTLLVDLGDTLQGGTLGSLSQGSIIYDLMNKMGYDIVELGNHDFDYGASRLWELLDKAEFDVVLCNVSYTGKKEDHLKDIPAYTIRDMQGTKVAFIGVLTPETLTASTPAYFQEDGEYVYDFSGGDNGKALAEKVQKAADDARAEGAEYVIVLSHLGSVPENAPYDAISLIHNTRGIDAVLDGHSHSVIIAEAYPNADGEDVVLSSVGTKMANVGELIITPDGEIHTLLLAEYDREDTAMADAVANAKAELQGILDRKIGNLPFDMPITDENDIRMIRSREKPIGNFCADAVRNLMETDVAILNGGGVRHTLTAGEVTYGNLLDVFPFQNELSSCRCTGQQIIDVLEYGAQKTESIYVFDEKPAGEYGGFLQVSGLKYTIDTSIPSGVQKDENGMFTEVVGEYRVKDVSILQNGEYVPIDPDATYTLSGTSYVLFGSGDGNTVLKDCEPVIANGPVDSEALITYMNELGTIPDSYREPEGRITVK